MKGHSKSMYIFNLFNSQWKDDEKSPYKYVEFFLWLKKIDSLDWMLEFECELIIILQLFLHDLIASINFP